VSILHEMQSVHRRATRAPHPRVRPHSDQSDWAMPWEKGCSMVFLDDIDEESGTLEYKPASHLQHFLREDGSQPAAGHPPRHDGPEVSDAYAAGEYLPVSLTAGSVVFRVPAVWHAVRPTYRLRRYATARYCLRTERPVATDMLGGIHEIVEKRKEEAAAAGEHGSGGSNSSSTGGVAAWQGLGAPLRSLCDPETVRVVPLRTDNVHKL
jgi:hypothetical protein